ncbi:hypothetical protein ACFRFJ_15665 [Streptomyces hydrogenans]|uniref:hypothetical protein n=1 Tax=Streptomyces hydrogenans TaxID=1873719 RepID=UPI003688A5E1
MSICDHAPELLAVLIAEYEGACPDHGSGDEAWAGCHCEIVADLRVKAALAATQREARGTTLPKNWRSAARRLGVSDDEYVARFERGEKWCGGCRTWHDRSHFGPDRGRGDGLQPRCRKASSRARRPPTPTHQNGDQP